MNNIQETIGELITDDCQQRDAIHVAVAPVVAYEKLYPGQLIGLRDGTNEAVSRPRREAHNTIGIVDPFLVGPVYPGDKFWAFLFPNTVTGMRHEWQHPAFVEFSHGVPAAWEYMRGLALGTDYTAEDLVEAGRDYLRSGYRLVQQDSETLREDTNAREYWKHFQAITGAVVPASELESVPFCCTC